MNKCNICGKKYKNKTGVSIHQSSMHPFHSSYSKLDKEKEIIELKSSFDKMGIQPKNIDIATKLSISCDKVKTVVIVKSDLIKSTYLKKLKESQEKYFEMIKGGNYTLNIPTRDVGYKRRTNPTIRKIALRRDEGKCRKCSIVSSGLEAHHIIPIWNGGQEIIDNYIMLCWLCHNLAPNDPKEFLFYLNTGLPVYLDKFFPLLKSSIEIMFERYSDKQIVEFRKNPLLLSKELYPEVVNLYKKAMEILNNMAIDEEE